MSACGALGFRPGFGRRRASTEFQGEACPDRQYRSRQRRGQRDDPALPGSKRRQQRPDAGVGRGKAQAQKRRGQDSQLEIPQIPSVNAHARHVPHRRAETGL